MFRGREQSKPELGFNLLKKLADEVAEDGIVESSPAGRAQHGHGPGPDPQEVRSPRRAEAEKDRRSAERDAVEAAEQQALADLRAAHVAKAEPKRRRGPSDNLDPDIDV